MSFDKDSRYLIAYKRTDRVFNNNYLYHRSLSAKGDWAETISVTHHITNATVYDLEDARRICSRKVGAQICTVIIELTPKDQFVWHLGQKLDIEHLKIYSVDDFHSEYPKEPFDAV